MKKMYSFATLLFLFIGTHAQDKNTLDAAMLIKIKETSDFPALVKLVNDLSYVVLDSSKQSDGSLFYFATEPKLDGNILGCSMDTKSKIHTLSFSTYNRATHDSLKKQISGLGFKSSGLQKKSSGILESEDFEKGKTLISLGAKKTEGGIQYEFMLINW